MLKIKTFTPLMMLLAVGTRNGNQFYSQTEAFPSPGSAILKLHPLKINAIQETVRVWEPL